MEVMWLVLFGLSLLCGGSTAAYLVKICFLWSAALQEEAAAVAEAAAEKGGERGLTAEELARLEEGKMGIGGGGECVVCLEEIEEGQVARVLPDCRHAFHRSCADAWLEAHPACPLCRARLHPPPPPPPSEPEPQPQPQPQPQSLSSDA